MRGRNGREGRKKRKRGGHGKEGNGREGAIDLMEDTNTVSCVQADGV